MKIFIVDDNKNIIRILEQIIEDKELGDLVGSAEDGLEASSHIENLKPDIVLVDLLMPGLDGIKLVEKLKKALPDTQFIMISQVTSKDMVSKAYDVGIEYFINKPIDAIEVQAVIKKVIKKIEMNLKLRQIESLFNNTSGRSDPNKAEDSLRE